MPLLRILLVEDYKPFQDLISSILRQRPEWQLIGIAQTGSEAIRRAQNHKPDVILIDIDLARMDGVKAAHEIRAVSPESKLVFLGQETSPALVREAFRLGAWGYIIKTSVRHELIEAVEGVFRHIPFISGAIFRQDFHGMNSIEADHRFNTAFSSMPLSKKQANGGRHEVHFYSEHQALLDRATRFLENAIRESRSVIVCASAQSWAALRSELRVPHWDTDTREQSSRYVSLNADEVIDICVIEKGVEAAKLRELFGVPILVDSGAGGNDDARISVYSEVASILWKQGKAQAMTEFERFCDQLSRTNNADILCGYPLSHFHGEEDEFAIKVICTEHNAIYSE